MLWCIPGFLRNEWTHAFKLLRNDIEAATNEAPTMPRALRQADGPFRALTREARFRMLGATMAFSDSPCEGAPA